MIPTSFDIRMMAIAVRMAERGLGQTAPNPAVGAVIADEASGEVIARGWTQPGGRPHAETEAIRRAGERARGATLYVTLEPCAHHGKTPPCADAIIAAGLTRVVTGAGDPDPRMAGQGIARLRGAGIEVTEGVCESEARWVSLGHILRFTEERPFVQIKLALDAACGIARGEKGRPVWVTGPEARAAGHMLRARADAILVGASAVREDDPELTCRLPGLGERSPVRVVMSGDLDLVAGAKLIASARAVPVWVITGPAAPEGRADMLERAGAHVIRLAAGEKPGVRDAMQALAGRGITRLLVEGGAGMWRAFADAGMGDEVVVFQAQPKGPEELGHGLGAASVPECQTPPVERWLPGLDLALAHARRIGDDRCFIYRRRG